jgi:hypothetical protein
MSDTEHEIVLTKSDEPDVMCTAEVEGFRVMVIESLDTDSEEVTMIGPDDATFDMFIVIPQRVLATVNGSIGEFITGLVAEAHRSSL